MSKTTAIILAAGKGTRLRPYTDEKPKCMVEVQGRSLLDWQIEVLRKSGIEDIVVVSGFKSEKIPDDKATKVQNHEYDSTNMVYSLFCAEAYLQNEVIITYGDILYQSSVVENVINTRQDIVIPSDEEWKAYWEKREENPLDDAETFKTGENNKVLELGQKASSIEEVQGQFIGMIKLTGQGCRIVKEAYQNCLTNPECKNNAWDSSRPLENAYMTDLLNYLAKEKGCVHYQPIQRGWFEIDDKEDLEVAEKEWRGWAH